MENRIEKVLRIFKEVQECKEVYVRGFLSQELEHTLRDIQKSNANSKSSYSYFFKFQVQDILKEIFSYINNRVNFIYPQANTDFLEIQNLNILAKDEMDTLWNIILRKMDSYTLEDALAYGLFCIKNFFDVKTNLIFNKVFSARLDRDYQYAQLIRVNQENSHLEGKTYLRKDLPMIGRDTIIVYFTEKEYEEREKGV